MKSSSQTSALRDGVIAAGLATLAACGSGTSSGGSAVRTSSPGAVPSGAKFSSLEEACEQQHDAVEEALDEARAAMAGKSRDEQYRRDLAHVKIERARFHVETEFRTEKGTSCFSEQDRASVERARAEILCPGQKTCPERSPS